MASIPTYRASQASRILNISTETLRTWESQGRLPFEVERTPGGQRRYPAAAVNALAEEQRAGRAALLSPRVEAARVPAPAQAQPAPTRPAWADGPVREHLAPADALVASGCAHMQYPADKMADPAVSHYATCALAMDSDGRPQIDQLRTNEGFRYMRIRMGVLDGPLRGRVGDLVLWLNQDYGVEPRTVSHLRTLSGKDIGSDGLLRLSLTELHEQMLASRYSCKVAERDRQVIVQYVGERMEMEPGALEPLAQAAQRILALA
jgi:hypothetical protein